MKAKIQATEAFCMVPQLSDEELASFRKIIEDLPDEQAVLRDVMQTMYKAVDVWWNLPESEGKDININVTEAGSGRKGVLTTRKVDAANQEKLFDLLPWDFELLAIQTNVLDKIPADQTELRNAAFKLCWYCKELSDDREPRCNDKVKWE